MGQKCARTGFRPTTGDEFISGAAFLAPVRFNAVEKTPQNPDARRPALAQKGVAALETLVSSDTFGAGQAGGGVESAAGRRLARLANNTHGGRHSICRRAQMEPRPRSGLQADGAGRNGGALVTFAWPARRAAT